MKLDAASTVATAALGPGRVARILVPFAFGYYLSYLFRTINAVIAPDLSEDLDLSADQLGLLTSTYFLSFAAAQLPLGIVLDRFGPRRTEAALLVVAALGALVFAKADSLTMLLIGRGLIGLGVSACLMAAFKAFVQWFARERLPFVNGVQMAAGGLGAMTATVPVEAVAAASDWRTVFLLLVGLCLIASAMVFFVVPPRDERATADQASLGAGVAGLGSIVASSLFWRVAPLTVASQAAFMAIVGLWAGPWLHDVGGLDRAAVAERLLAIAAAMVAGFLTMGYAADRLSRLRIAPFTVALSGMILFAMTLAAIIVSPSGGSLGLWLAFGFFGTSGIVPYAALSQRFPAALAGRLNTTLNVLVFAAAFVAQWGMGAVIDMWPAGPGGGQASDGYRSAFILMLALKALALGWYAMFRGARVPPG